MTNSYCSGIIGTTPAGLIRRPSYHVMKLYADHAKPIPLQLTEPATARTCWRAPTSRAGRSASSRSTFAASP